MTPSPAIENCGLVGNTRCAALISNHGDVVWMSAPHFDSPPLFSSLIDPDNGGAFRIGPVDGAPSEQRYRPDTATLETTWQAPGFRATLSDAMIVAAKGATLPQTLLIRTLRCETGGGTFVVEMHPRLGLPGTAPSGVRRYGGAAVATWGGRTAALLTLDRDAHVLIGAPTTLRLVAGEQVVCCLAIAVSEPLVRVASEQATALVEAGDRDWISWSRGITTTPYPELVRRSAITLRLLLHSPTGAPVAAPTTSLPEKIGGSLNWDYRYSWPRDASLGVGAFAALGKPDEAGAFARWLYHASRLTRPKLNPLYRLDGRNPAKEVSIDASTGFRHSTPVRTGNAAAEQSQLDVYGWVLDGLYTMDRYGIALPRHVWRMAESFADYCCSRWNEDDASLWESRATRAPYTHSKLWAWLALDRAVSLSERQRSRRRRVARWIAARDTLREVILLHGTNNNGYLARLDKEDSLDASLSLAATCDFEDPTGIRIRNTLDEIQSSLGAGPGLLFRNAQSRDQGEGAFAVTSCWFVQALCRSGQRERAQEFFDAFVERLNPIGLVPEEIDPNGFGYLGNYPLALSHAGLIQAVLDLRD